MSTTTTRRPRPAGADLDALQSRMPAPLWFDRLDALRRAEGGATAVDDAPRHHASEPPGGAALHPLNGD
jgi:hypothetical protein